MNSQLKTAYGWCVSGVQDTRYEKWLYDDVFD